MSNVFKKYANKVGLPPGTLVYTGENKTEPILINQIDYNETQCQESKIEKYAECQSIDNPDTITWIHIQGIHDAESVREIGAHFSIHTLVLEDIMNPTQLPKIEEFDEYTFCIIRTLNYDIDTNSISDDPINLVVGHNYVISLQESGEKIFQPIHNRIVSNQGRIRKMHAEYLAYTLIDLVVDNYFLVVEQVSETIEFLEEEAITNPTPDILKKINHIRRQMLHLRKQIVPLRDVVSEILSGELKILKEDTHPYFRDLYDHILQLIHTLETLRMSASTLFDTYSTALNHKMNEVMKVLTLVATFFIPLTFIAGIYGMNFQNMPELRMPWGYPIVLLVMLGISVTMFIYFKKKKWF